MKSIGEEVEGRVLLWTRMVAKFQYSSGGGRMGRTQLEFFDSALEAVCRRTSL